MGACASCEASPGPNCLAENVTPVLNISLVHRSLAAIQATGLWFAGYDNGRVAIRLLQHLRLELPAATSTQPLAYEIVLAAPAAFVQVRASAVPWFDCGPVWQLLLEAGHPRCFCCVGGLRLDRA